MYYSRDKWLRWEKFLECCGDMSIVAISVLYDSYAAGRNDTVISLVDLSAHILETRWNA